MIPGQEIQEDSFNLPPVLKSLMKGSPTCRDAVGEGIAWFAGRCGKEKEKGEIWSLARRKMQFPLLVRAHQCPTAVDPARASKVGPGASTLNPTSSSFLQQTLPSALCISQDLPTQTGVQTCLRCPALPAPCSHGVSRRHPLGCGHLWHRFPAVAACFVRRPSLQHPIPSPF